MRGTCERRRATAKKTKPPVTSRGFCFLEKILKPHPLPPESVFTTTTAPARACYGINSMRKKHSPIQGHLSTTTAPNRRQSLQPQPHTGPSFNHNRPQQEAVFTTTAPYRAVLTTTAPNRRQSFNHHSPRRLLWYALTLTI